MQFHIEIDEDKAHAWANDEDPLWAEARALHNTVQDGQEIIQGIDTHLAQHQRTADHIYGTWLSTTVWKRV